MFFGCEVLKGAVAYDANKTDAAMANPETGYFTSSSTPVAYVVVADGVLTFYYDNLRAERTGTVYGIHQKDTVKSKNPAWTGATNTVNITKAVFDASFKNYSPETTAFWFYNLSALNAIVGMENLNTSNVTDMGHMFQVCSSLREINLSSFNTSNVTDMDHMFIGCRGLMELDLSGFNTTNVTNMGAMFSGCSGLTKLDLSSFNTENVISMFGMFDGCSGLMELRLKSFNTANVLSMTVMFRDCSKLTKLDLSNFNNVNVERMDMMFSGCSGLTEFDLTNFNTANVTTMEQMFEGCSGLKKIDISSFNTENVNILNNMFRGCSGLTELDLTNFNTVNVSRMYGMFYGCSGLTTIYCDDTWQCEWSDGMFSGCEMLRGAVAYDAGRTDYTMANPETGYFTSRTVAIPSISTDESCDGPTVIYNLQGIRMHDDLNSLPAGIYIINGKKVYVK